MSQTTTVAPGGNAKRAAAATAASEKLADALRAAGSARDALIAKRYGADVTPAAVTLAKRAADELSGASKSRGGARARVLAVVAGIPEDVTPTDAVMVAAARTVLDNDAADAKARRDRKRELARTVNDAAASSNTRAAALDVLAGMDDADNDAKRARVRERFAAALEAAHKLGMPADELTAMVAKLYAVDIVVSYPAAIPADAETVAA